MGRFYSGDIEGKFWFGVQSSGDVENLVTITPHTFYSWIFRVFKVPYIMIHYKFYHTILY